MDLCLLLGLGEIPYTRSPGFPGALISVKLAPSVVVGIASEVPHTSSLGDNNESYWIYFLSQVGGKESNTRAQKY
jgi:hypothetical protein